MQDGAFNYKFNLGLINEANLFLVYSIAVLGATNLIIIVSIKRKSITNFNIILIAILAASLVSIVSASNLQIKQKSALLLESGEYKIYIKGDQRAGQYNITADAELFSGTNKYDVKVQFSQ